MWAIKHSLNYVNENHINVFSYCNGIKIDISNKKDICHILKLLEIMQHTGKYWLSQREFFKKLGNMLNQMKSKIQHNKNLWDAAKVVLRGKFIALKCLY